MKTYKTQEEVNKDIKNNILIVNGNVEFECDICINASIIVDGNINALDINAFDINAFDINARDINAFDIKAGDIVAWDIKAKNIDARDITYYGFCCAYHSIRYSSIKSNRKNGGKHICLDGEIVRK